MLRLLGRAAALQKNEKSAPASPPTAAFGPFQVPGGRRETHKDGTARRRVRACYFQRSAQATAGNNRRPCAVRGSSAAPGSGGCSSAVLLFPGREFGRRKAAAGGQEVWVKASEGKDLVFGAESIVNIWRR